MESIDDPLTESPINRRHQQRHLPPPTAKPQLTPPKASHSDGRRPRTSNKVHPKSVRRYVVSFCTCGVGWGGVGGHVVNMLSAIESCTRDLHQKSVLLFQLIYVVVLHLANIYTFVWFNWTEILRLKGLFIFILENHRGSEQLAWRLNCHALESKSEHASLKQECFNRMCHICFCCFCIFFWFKNN